MQMHRRTWAEINLDNLVHNCNAALSRTAKGTKFLGVVKADAYGHGSVEVAKALNDAGAAYLSVHSIDEALELRRGGMELPILLFGVTESSFAPVLAENMLTQEVHSIEYARALSLALDGTNKKLKVHIKLDTGMTRLGFSVRNEEALFSEMKEIAEMKDLNVEGVFTHFSVSDSLSPEDTAYTKAQYDFFRKGISVMEKAGIKPKLRHCCNSGATLLYPEFSLDMIRPGIMMYGYAPSSDTKGIAELKPVMTLKSAIAEIKDIPKGASVSYGRTFTAKRDMRLGILPIGYADGLPRALSGNFTFLIGEKEVPLVGRICMDVCMLDLTDFPDAKIGDVAIVFGEGRPCDEIAEKLGTISYELLCGVARRVPRVYISGGREIGIKQYL